MGQRGNGHICEVELMEDERAYKCCGTTGEGKLEVFAIIRAKDMGSAINILSLMPMKEYQRLDVELVPVESLR